MEVKELAGTLGVDRNLRNVTAGNEVGVTFYDISKVVEICENTRGIIRSFKRDDVRIRRKISAKYGRRRSERVRQILHGVSKSIIHNAKVNRRAIVFEEMRGIRRLYRRGNVQSRVYRSKMNSWPFSEMKRQVEYKAGWEGVPVLTLTVNETRGSSLQCVRCGERLQAALRDDAQHRRQIWCERCERWFDRDLIAAMNISRRGWMRFVQSKGVAGEAVKGNAEHEGEPPILRVDASKLCMPGVDVQ